MRYLITCLIVAALAGCDRAADTAGSPDPQTSAANTELVTAADPAAHVPETVKEPSGRVIEYGIYNAQRKGRIRDDIASSTGKVISQAVLELAEQTNRIPLVKDTYFAYRYRILDLPKDVAKRPVVELRKVLLHPEMTLPDGSTTTGADSTFKGRTSAGQVIGFDGYAFNEDYELVEGDWAFQIWYGDKMMVEQTFTTYWPEQGAGADAGAERSAVEPAVENSI